MLENLFTKPKKLAAATVATVALSGCGVMQDAVNIAVTPVQHVTEGVLWTPIFSFNPFIGSHVLSAKYDHIFAPKKDYNKSMYNGQENQEVCKRWAYYSLFPYFHMLNLLG